MDFNISGDRADCGISWILGNCRFGGDYRQGAVLHIPGVLSRDALEWSYERQQALAGSMQLENRSATVSVTVSVALAGVSPASHTAKIGSLSGDSLPNADIFGETPKTAAETAALPKSCCIVPA